MLNQTGRRSVRIAVSFLMILTWGIASSASAQGRRNGGGSITVFTNPNYGGQSVSFSADTPDLRGYSLNDKISSIQIPSGESWQICQDINFGNQCLVLSGSVSDLRSMGWNDRISSLRRVSNGFRDTRPGSIFRPNYGNNAGFGNGSERLLLFDRPNFRGNTLTVTGNENGSFGNRNLGSAQVRGGAWEVCDRSGRCATVTQDVPDISRLGLRDRIVSARLVNQNGQYDRGRGRNR
jgi:Beta/Gamma crystallin